MSSNSKKNSLGSIFLGKSSKRNQGLLFFTVILISTLLILISAIKYNDHYLMLTESFSSLGIRAENPNGYIFFRIALLLAGISFIPHFIYIFRIYHPTAYHTSRAALVISIISCFGVIGAGIFPENNPIPHYSNAFVAFIGFTIVFSCYLYIFIKKWIDKDPWPKIWEIIILYTVFFITLIGFLFVFFLFWLYYYRSIIFIDFSLPLWEWIFVFGIFYWIIGSFIITREQDQM